jgi:hypothetical protein
MRGFSFSWKRALGVSAVKGRIARATGVPLTRSGRQRKLGRAAPSMVFWAFILGVACVAVCGR